VRLCEVNLPLAALDVLEPDLVLQVDATDGGRGHLSFSEVAMEKVRPLDKGQVGGLLQGRRGDQVAHLLLGELRPPQQLDLEPVTVRAHAQPDELHHGGDGPLEHPRNCLIVEDGPGEVGVLARAEAQEGDVA